MFDLITSVFTELDKFKLALNIDDKLISFKFFNIYDFFVFCKELLQPGLNFVELKHDFLLKLSLRILIGTVDFFLNNHNDILDFFRLKLLYSVDLKNLWRSICRINHLLCWVWLSRFKLVDKDRSVFTCAVDKLA